MSVTPVFNTSANLIQQALDAKASGEALPSEKPPRAPKAPRQKRPAPFSIRLSEADRARLAIEAAGTPLGSYIKAKLLDGKAAKRNRPKGGSIRDREAFAQALALLGRSHLSSNLNQLAHAVNIGVLPVTPETEAFLKEAVQDVKQLRHLFMTALGHVEDAP